MLMPVIPFIGQYLESILNGFAMVALILFHFGTKRKQFLAIFQQIMRVDNMFDSIGINVNNAPSKKFLYISNCANIVLNIFVLMAYNSSIC